MLFHAPLLVLLILLGVTLPPSTTASEPGKLEEYVCPNGFIRYYRSCYKFVPKRVPWLMAQQYCKVMRAHLAWVESPQEHHFLKTHIRQHEASFPFSFWIGGNDFANEGQWHWESSNEPVIFSAWGSGQPDNGQGQEDCMEMEWRWNYRWNDQPCDMLNFFICQVQLY